MDADRSDPEAASRRDSEREPIMDRRLGPDRRSGDDRRRRAAAEDDAAARERRRAGDRRRVDRRASKGPAPERRPGASEMTPEVLAFVDAVRRYRDLHDNRFPTASEILTILKNLGYEKRES